MPVFLIMAMAANAMASAAPDIQIKLFPLYESSDEPSIEVVATSTAPAIRVVIKNNSTENIQIIWGDFFARTGGGRWLASWWSAEENLPVRLSRCFTGQPSLSLPNMPPAGEISCVLVDPWPSESSPVEYKFACLIACQDGRTYLKESSPLTPLSAESGLSPAEVAINGVSSALRSLLSDSPELTVKSPSEVGVSVQYSPLGLVEILKNAKLVDQIRQWEKNGNLSAEDSYFYGYQTEVVNNTTSPIKLVQIVSSTLHDGHWLSGVIDNPILTEAEIVEAAYLSSFDETGSPLVKKATDSWIPPGSKMFFPNHWHPKVGESTPLKHLVILLKKTGEPVYVEGRTNDQMSPVRLPKDGLSLPVNNSPAQ